MPARACRGCLATGPRLYNIYVNNLNDVFGEVVGNPISESDDLPQHLCGMCFAQLAKYISFRNRCRLAQDILQDLKLQGMKLSTRFIKQIDRSKCNLVTNLEIVTPLNCDLIIQEEFYDVPLTESQDEVSDYKIEALSPEFLEVIHENIDNFPSCKSEPSEWSVASPGGDEALHEDDGVEENFILSPSSKLEPTWFTPESPRAQTATVTSNQALSPTSDMPTKELIPISKQSTTNPKERVQKNINENLKIIEEFKKKYNMDVKFLTKEQQIDAVKEKIRQSSTRLGAGPYCSYCGKSCVSETNLEKHKKECHDESSGYNECEICRYRLPSHQLEKHLQTHRVRILCQLCDFTTKTFPAAMYHARQHGVYGEPLNFPCKYCDSVFEKRELLDTHISRDHLSKLPWCKFCGETVLNKTGMRYHMRSHKILLKSRFKCLQCCLNLVTSEALGKHSSLTCEEYNCVMCGDHFESKMLLKEHLIQEHARSKYIKLAHCEGCGVKFFGSEPLEKHLGEKSCGSGHPCQNCGLTFRNEKTLEQHKLEFHLKQYQACESCDKAFDLKSYRQHISRVHNTEPPSASSKGIHPHTSAKLWSVEDSVISGVEAPPTEPASDERPKSTLICDVCGKTFLKYVNLETHMRAHTGETPFSCDVSSKGYTRKEALKCHPGIRRHICRICGKKFSTSSGVKIHIKSVHLHERVRAESTRQSNEQGHMDTQGHMETQGHMDTQGHMVTQGNIDSDNQEHIDSETHTEDHNDTQNNMDNEEYTQNHTDTEVTQYYMDDEIETQDYMDTEIQTQDCIDKDVQNHSVVKIIPVNKSGRPNEIPVENKNIDYTQSYIETRTQYYLDNGIIQDSSVYKDTFDTTPAAPRITKTIHIKRRRKRVTSDISKHSTNENTHSQDSIDTHKQVYMDNETHNQVIIEYDHIENDEQTQNHIVNDENTLVYMNSVENIYDHETQIQDYDDIIASATNSIILNKPERDEKTRYIENIVGDGTHNYNDMHTQDFTDNNIIQSPVVHDNDVHSSSASGATVQRITKTIHVRRRKKQTVSNIPTQSEDTNTHTQDHMDTHAQDYMDSDITQAGLVQNQESYSRDVATVVPRITKTIHVKNRKKGMAGNIPKQH